MLGRCEAWTNRGFGFVRAGGRHYFVHASDIKERETTLRPGELVIFTPAEHERGRRAIQVRRAPTTCPKCGAELDGAAVCAACELPIEALAVTAELKKGVI
jgi:cold shock CspA family protein